MILLLLLLLNNELFASQYRAAAAANPPAKIAQVPVPQQAAPIALDAPYEAHRLRKLQNEDFNRYTAAIQVIWQEVMAFSNKTETNLVQYLDIITAPFLDLDKTLQQNFESVEFAWKIFVNQAPSRAPTENALFALRPDLSIFD